MVRLSFSTLNTTIQAPHTYINKMLGMKTFSIQAFEDGKKIHKIIQDHCSGVTPHKLLASVPTFSVVETMDFDPKMRIEFPVNDKYSMNGFVDMLDPKTKTFGEIKSGKAWSAGEFARTPQWKIYAVGLPEYKKVYLINTPKDEKLWMPETIRIFNKDITEEDKQQAMDFIQKGIAVIENIRDEVDKEMAMRKEKGWTGRSRSCFYEECNFCK